jgi:hypothetical protein
MATQITVWANDQVYSLQILGGNFRPTRQAKFESHCPIGKKDSIDREILLLIFLDLEYHSCKYLREILWGFNK